MQVVIIGSGNIATVLGRLMFKNGHRIMQVWSRTEANATILAKQLEADAITDIAQIDQGADLYLLAVTDSAMAETAAKLVLKDQLVVHTAGAVSKDILQYTSTRYGVLWPMKMIRKTMTAIDPASVVIDGNTTAVINQITALAHEFSHLVTSADDATRSKMHLLAAITANFPNHLYHLAADYCAAQHIDFSLFYPIIADTARQIQTAHPREVQAGPAFRDDITTLQKHEALLQDYPGLLKVYEVMSESIRKKFNV